MVNSRKIKARMVEMGLTQKDIASDKVWNCALPTVSQKLNGVRPIYLEEADALAKVLKLTEDEYFLFFFS